MRIPLVRPNMPKLAEVQEYYQLAEKQGQYSNFGLCYEVAVSKLQKVYPGSHPVLVNNGTTAIQIALQATLPRGSRVALPTFTFTATLSAVVAAGMVPVLVDVYPHSWQINSDLLIDTKWAFDAFIVVSPFGYAVDVESYDALSESLDRPVIYDFAPAWGHPISKQNPTTFSFHATKTLPIGEGGAVMFPNAIHKKIAKQLINFDFIDQKPLSMYGMNGKMDELHCATLCTQLDRNEELLSAFYLNQTVIDQIALLSSIKVPKSLINYLQIPVIDVGPNLSKISEYLSNHKIASRRYYSPLLHDVFPEVNFIKAGELVAPRTTLGLPRPSNMVEALHIARMVGFANE